MHNKCCMNEIRNKHMAVGSKAIDAVNQTFNNNGTEGVTELKCLGVIAKTIRTPDQDMLTD